MNTIICYLTALGMQVAAMNMTVETDSISLLPNQQCEKHTSNKLYKYPSKTTEELFPLFFLEEQKYKGKN